MQVLGQLIDCIATGSTEDIQNMLQRNQNIADKVEVILYNSDIARHSANKTIFVIRYDGKLYSNHVLVLESF